MYILGISAFYHDSAAALIKDGAIIAAAQEERFTRVKHDASFPANAVKYCLGHAGISIGDVEILSFYDKPFLKFERLLETYLAFAPKGLISFTTAMPVWLKEKLFFRKLLEDSLRGFFGLSKKDSLPKILFSEHHGSHAASAFFPSPFKSAAILTADGVGEWATTSLARATDNCVEIFSEIHFPHSLGLLYSAFTYYTGFRVNSGEYKVMGLAPYGEPKYVNLIRDNLIDIKEDGSFRLNMSYFNYCTGLTMTNAKFHRLFGAPPRKPETALAQREMDIARSIQVVIEDALLKITRHLHKQTKEENLCLAGGVALNCVANGRILKEGPFKNIWIQPAASDAGAALGTALDVWYRYLGNKREPNPNDSMSGSLLGPSFSNDEIEAFLKKTDIKYKKLDKASLYKTLADLLSREKVIGWLSGRMEFGPRALGSRSILGDARSTKMQSIMNLKIKYRESFRPFAPSVLREDVDKYFDLDCDSPYMLLVAQVKKERCVAMDDKAKGLWGIEKLNVPRSDIPAVTHVDYSARVQTISPDKNENFYELIKAFKEKTGYSVLVNTSFNVRGEPIVCTPEDAYRCFMRTEMDYLVLENFILDKSDQKPLDKDVDWKKQFELD